MRLPATLFRYCFNHHGTKLIRSKHKCATAVKDLSSLDPKQVELLNEMCIVVDENDKAIAARSKKDCHLMTNINNGLLHRAFSVFLFNNQGELLVQQRADAKITFPGCFTNTCCSHPLYIPKELEEDGAIGVKRAAQRRLFIELGIESEQLLPEEFDYLTRIQYKAPSDGHWGESEIDYILVAQKDVQIIPNPNEVKETLYISRKDFQSFIKSLEKRGQPLTPWFRLIADSLLLRLWDNLGDLSKLKDHKKIHRM